MSESLRNRIYALAILVMAVVVVWLIATNPSEGDRIESLGNSIRCPVCQGESIADSPSAMARDMMALVSERVADGRTDQEIIDELLASYTGAVLLDPPASGATLFLWLAPIAAIAIGAGIIVWWERHPGAETSHSPTSEPRSKRRMLVGGLVLAASFGAVVVVVGFFVQDEGSDRSSGVAQQQAQNLEDVSNETMEAVIAANLDDPQISGMRLALAERYFSTGDYRSAFPHYLAVAESEESSGPQVIEALVRLGWMAWDGNAEIEPALGMFDRALSLDPDSSTALYLKAKVIWCGKGDFEEAAKLLTTVIDNGDLPAESLQLVEADLESVGRREACT